MTLLEGTSNMDNEKLICDHCGKVLHRQVPGNWYIGKDETSDCDANEGGHEVNGDPR